MMVKQSPIRLAEKDHVVHFYDAEQDLVALVGSYLSAAVLDGDAVIVIATPDHVTALTAAMSAAGVDTEAKEDGGDLVLVDADEVLARFMVGDMPSAEAFDSVVGGLVRRVAATERPVRAFGEMVALLWARGNPAGAAELERLWNGLRDSTPFALFCGYPRSLVAGTEEADAFAEVCALHSHVLDGAPLPAGAESSKRFMANPHAARRARRFVEATVAAWNLDELRDAAVLAAGELAANAVMHAGGDFTISLKRLPGRLRLMVGDSTLRPVERREAPPMATSGRGLSIVAALADAWGCEVRDTGKIIWADFRRSASPAVKA